MERQRPSISRLNVEKNVLWYDDDDDEKEVGEDQKDNEDDGDRYKKTKKLVIGF